MPPGRAPPPRPPSPEPQPERCPPRARTGRGIGRPPRRAVPGRRRWAGPRSPRPRRTTRPARPAPPAHRPREPPARAGPRSRRGFRRNRAGSPTRQDRRRAAGAPAATQARPRPPSQPAENRLVQLLVPVGHGAGVEPVARLREAPFRRNPPSRSVAAAIPFTDGDMNPVTPSVTSSFTAPSGVAMTGVPEANASTITRPNGSGSRIG